MPNSSLEEIEFKLKQAQESLVFALQSGRMGTWDFSLETGSINCSQEMLDLWNVSREEFNNEREILQSKVHPEDLELMKSAIDEAISNKSVYELEYRIIPSPGVVKWVLSRGRCTFEPNSDRPLRFAGVVYDISERRVKEEATRYAAKIRDQFFQIAGHELKTPLTCLHLQIQVMEWEMRQKHADTFSLDRIATGLKKQQNHLKRISRIVDNILDESKITVGRLLLQFEHFDLAEMVQEVFEDFEVTAKAFEVEVSYKSKHSVPGMYDRYRMEQVLQNLLLNAIRFGNKKPVQVEVLKDGDHALLIVRDNGYGIKEEDQERIFERFERVISENEISGMGLGLFISRNIVRDHKGDIFIKSEPGEGTEFTVRVPLNF